MPREAPEPRAPEPKPPAQSPEASERKRRATRLAEEVWSWLASAHGTLKAEGIDRGAPAIGLMQNPLSPGYQLAVERCTELLDFHGLDEARQIARHRLDVAIAEARAADPPTLRYFAPPRFFHPSSWEVATSMSVEAASVPRAGPRRGRPTAEPEAPRRIPEV